MRHICVILLIANGRFYVVQEAHNPFVIKALKNKGHKDLLPMFRYKNIPPVIKTLVSSVLWECDGVGRHFKYTMMLHFTEKRQVVHSLPCTGCKMVILFSSSDIIHDFYFL